MPIGEEAAAWGCNEGLRLYDLVRIDLHTVIITIVPQWLACTAADAYSILITSVVTVHINKETKTFHMCEEVRVVWDVGVEMNSST